MLSIKKIIPWKEKNPFLIELKSKVIQYKIDTALKRKNKHN